VTNFVVQTRANQSTHRHTRTLILCAIAPLIVMALMKQLNLRDVRPVMG